MQSQSTKRPMGISVVAALLVTLGAEIFGAATAALVLDIGRLAAIGGFREQVLLQAMATAGFAMAAFGLGLWRGYSWARHASMAATAVLVVLSVAGCVENGFGLTRVTALLIMNFGALAYLVMPTVRNFVRPTQAEQAAYSGSYAANVAGVSVQMR